MGVTLVLVPLLFAGVCILAKALEKSIAPARAVGVIMSNEMRRRVYEEVLASNPHGKTLSEIAAALGTTRQTVAYHLAQLCESGVVERRGNRYVARVRLHIRAYVLPENVMYMIVRIVPFAAFCFLTALLFRFETVELAKAAAIAATIYSLYMFLEGLPLKKEAGKKSED